MICFVKPSLQETKFMEMLSLTADILSVVRFM